MIVVDCSPVIDALVGPDAEAIGARLEVERLVAPALLDFEFLSAVRGLTLGGRVSEHRARDLLHDFERLPVTRWGFAGDLRARAFDLRHSISAYDASYVVLAEALECPLLTRDRRLAQAAEKLIEVIVV